VQPDNQDAAIARQFDLGNIVSINTPVDDLTVSFNRFTLPAQLVENQPHFIYDQTTGNVRFAIPPSTTNIDFFLINSYLHVLNVPSQPPMGLKFDEASTEAISYREAGGGLLLPGVYNLGNLVPPGTRLGLLSGMYWARAPYIGPQPAIVVPEMSTKAISLMTISLVIAANGGLFRRRRAAVASD
jgi:hypothetical protein